MTPQKPIEHFTMKECYQAAREYFPDPIIFKKRGHVHFCVDKATGTTWGSGNSVGAAFVDGMARMELRKKKALDLDAAKKASFKRKHPIKHRYRAIKKSIGEMVETITAKWQGRLR